MNKEYFNLTAVLIAAMLCVFVAEAPGASRNWNGSFDNDWFTGVNWTPNGIPANNDDLTVGPYLPLPPYPPRPSTTTAVFVDGGGSITAVTSMGRAYFDDLTIGDTGSGSMDILTMGSISSVTGYVGRSSTGAGSVTVDGGSRWSNSSSLYIGYNGDGELLVTNDGDVTSDSSYLASNQGSSGSATVTGAGSTWTTGSLYVGSSAPASGSLTIADGGLVSSSYGGIGNGLAASGSASVTGVDSEWSITGALWMGANGTGTLTVGGGGKVRADGTLTLDNGGMFGGGRDGQSQQRRTDCHRCGLPFQRGGLQYRRQFDAANEPLVGIR